MPSLNRIVVVLALILAGCVIGEESNAVPDPGPGEPPPDAPQQVADPCTETCMGVERDHEPSVVDGNYATDAAARWATCFSCRCKQQLGALPPPEELTCSSAEGPLARWRPTRDAAGRITGVEQIDPAGTDTSECLNPGMAAAGCDLQARFKRMVYNDGKTEFQQLCRKRDVGSNGYYEYLLIGHNRENGATCFWQARDSTFGGEDVPPIDLAAATAADKRKYAETFYLYSAGPSNCTSCHATDAFLTSPYLSSQWSIAQANGDPMTRSRIHPSSPYALVTADRARPEPVVHEDVAAPGKPLHQACGSCHKVAKGSYCGFATRSVAEDRVFNATPADREVLVQKARALVTWMPPGGLGSHAQAVQLQDLVRDACAN